MFTTSSCDAKMRDIVIIAVFTIRSLKDPVTKYSTTLTSWA